MTIYRELLNAVRQEVTQNPDNKVSGPGLYSRSRESLQWFFDCYYSGENLVPFVWTDEYGQEYDDFKVADICFYKVPRVEILATKAGLNQFYLVASGAILERISDSAFIAADNTTAGYLLAVVTA